MRRYKLVFAVVVVHDSNEVEDFVGVTDFIIVPGDDFYEGVRQSNTSFSIENGRERATEEVRGNNSFVSVAEDAFEFAFRCFFIAAQISS